MRRVFLCAFLCALTTGTIFAGKKVVSSTTSGDNDAINVTATLFLKPEEITQQIGADPGPEVVVLHVRVTPKVDKPVSVSPDDFILLAHDDGERNQPYDPAQIAGKGVMIIKEQKQDSVGTNPIRPSIGGIAIGSSSTKTSADANKDKPPTTMSDSAPEKSDLLAKLKAKELAAQDVEKPVEGLLYFRLAGKHKLKNMAVLYRGPSGHIDMEFEH